MQRQERELNLPVHRPKGKIKGSVIATKLELDAWVTVAPVRNMFQLSPDWVAKNAIETRATLDTLRRLVAEMKKLRQESAESRIALHESVALLRKNLCFSLVEERPDRADVLSFQSKRVQ